MEDFLKQLHLSPNAIKIYVQSLGRFPLSFVELYSIVSDISKEDFQKVINELVELGLFIPIIPQSPEILLQYLAIPPFNPIINYIANINANLESIKNQLNQLLTNTLRKLFQERKLIELDTTFETIQELRKDFEEETIIQKQDVDDIVKGMENIKVTGKVLKDLNQSIKGITQAQFGNLIKIISNIKTEINKELEKIELKKLESEVKKVIDDVFKDNLDKLLGDFTTKLYKLIETEFNNTIESLNNIIDSNFQFRDDFKMLLVNMLNNFEIKIKKITELIKIKKKDLSKELESFEQEIENNFDQIIRNSVESVAALNNPIDKVMKNYYQAITKSDVVHVRNFWMIRNLSRINEETVNFIKNSKNEITFIFPKLEHHLDLEQFNNISSNIKIKIASSEAHTNSMVKKFKEIKGLEYRTLKNESIIIMKGDDKHLVIGIVQNDRDSMNNIIGFGSNYKPLIQLIEPLIRSTWNLASSDLHETPKSIGIKIKSPDSTKMSQIKPLKPIVAPSQTRTSIQKPKIIQTNKTLSKQKAIKQEIPINSSKETTDFSQKLQQQVDFTSKATPKAGDETGFVINNAFNTLIEKLGNLKGYQFSQELQKVSDLVLERRGFSVTLHKLRSLILKFKEQNNNLNQNDISEIIQNIEEWKKHLL